MQVAGRIVQPSATTGGTARGYAGYGYQGAAPSASPRVVAAPSSALSAPSGARMTGGMQGARPSGQVGAATLAQRPSAAVAPAAAANQMPRPVQAARVVQTVGASGAPQPSVGPTRLQYAPLARSVGATQVQGTPQAAATQSNGRPLKAASRYATEPAGGLAPDSELGHLLLLLRNPNLLSQCARKIFRKHDIDGNGVLSMQEMMDLMPVLHKDIGLSIVEHDEDLQSLVSNRMRKYDLNGDGVLNEQEFLELYRWTLWLKYEDLEPPIHKRSELIQTAKKGSPSKYYELGGQLGQGQFGIVNMVKHRASGAERVLKTINKRMAVQAGTPLAMLSQEMDILALLDHPHILRLFEHYNDTENIYIITDVCKGGHLLEIVEEHCVQRRPLPEAWVARVFKQAIEAIGYCHAKGIMHKDIKFENLMLNERVTCESPVEDIHVIVIDVGLSELFGAQHGKGLRSNIIAGSPATMAPEVIRRDFSFKCDIWSFGCLLYAIFNNQPAYLPDGAGGQVLYTYPFAPVQTDKDPFGIRGLLDAQIQGPSMDRMKDSSPEAKEVVLLMLTCIESERPDAAECLQMPWFSSYNPTTTISLSEDQVQALTRDREVSIWRRTVTLEAATQLPVSAVMGLQKEFEAMAASTGGTQIECSVLAEALERHGVSGDVAQKVADVADMDRSGMIEWSEFVAAMLPACHELFAELIQRVFQEYDVNHDGTLDRNEVARLLQEGKIDSQHMPQSKTVDMMIEELDENHDGRISYAEFHDYLLRVDGHH